MYYFLLHNLFKYLPPFNDMRDIQRNCITLLIGTILYILTYGFLKLRRNVNHFYEVMHNFYVFMIIADMCCMAVIYREYYGRNIASEIFDSPTIWEYDEDKGKYKRTDLAEKQEFFKDKMDKLEKIDDTLDEAQDVVETFKEKIDEIEEIKENLDELDNAIKYHPDGAIASTLAKNYVEKAKEHDNPIEN